MRLLYDGLAIFDVVVGFLLVVICFQILYVAVFRALHGSDANAPKEKRGVTGRGLGD